MKNHRRIDYVRFNTPLGSAYVGALEGRIVKIDLHGKEFFSWVEKKFPGHGLVDQTDAPSKVLMEARDQIVEYLEGRRSEFDVPYDLKGTEFQMDVWKEMAGIPWGKTITYSQLAEAVGRPRAARAIGGACNKNPLPLVIPCHRVVGRDGSMVGFGSGIDVKEKLLKMEKYLEEDE